MKKLLFTLLFAGATSCFGMDTRINPREGLSRGKVYKLVKVSESDDAIVYTFELREINGRGLLYGYQVRAMYKGGRWRYANQNYVSMKDQGSITDITYEIPEGLSRFVINTFSKETGELIGPEEIQSTCIQKYSVKRYSVIGE